MDKPTETMSQNKSFLLQISFSQIFVTVTGKVTNKSTTGLILKYIFVATHTIVCASIIVLKKEGNLLHT
jgi:hypothetical protein